MQTLSSANFTCSESASASECTATVSMSSSLQARMMRSAISPRLAMRIFLNIGGQSSRSPDPASVWGARLQARLARTRPQPVRRGLELVPGLIAGGGDPAHAQRQLVRVGAGLQRLRLGDAPVLDQLHERLVEGLHA